MTNTAWTLNDNNQASREGWGVFDNSERGIEIERIDDPEDGSDPIFQSDDDAIAFVKRRADDGSAFHSRALDLHRTGNN